MPALTIRSRALLLCASLLAAPAACGRDTGDAPRPADPAAGLDSIGNSAAGAGDVADSASADTAAPPPDSAVREVLERFLARVPGEVLVRRGACPFECCAYREWTAEGAIPVLAAERGSGRPLITITPGQRFRADSGNVWITGLMLVAVRNGVGDPPYWSFSAGDTLVVLDHIGEGHFNVWHAGRVLDVEGFWASWRQQPAARTLGEHRSEWWVHVTLPDGRGGWFEASPAVRFSGADACG